MSKQIPVLKKPLRMYKGNRKLIAILLLLFVILLAVLFFNTSISKIDTIHLEGMTYTAENDIIQAAGIKKGDPFFLTSTTELIRRIERVPEIESVEVAKRFPGEVRIKVTEHTAVAYELGEDGAMSILLASGTAILQKEPGRMLTDKPMLSGWAADDPYKQELAKQLGLIPSEGLADLSEIKPDPSTAYPDRIKIYTRSKFEIITAVSVIASKIEGINKVIETQEPGRITMLLADTYVPFDSEVLSSVQYEDIDATQ